MPATGRPLAGGAATGQTSMSFNTSLSSTWKIEFLSLSWLFLIAPFWLLSANRNRRVVPMVVASENTAAQEER